MHFSEVVGQEDIKQRLLAQFCTGHHPHALLLTGPEGCGKLSMALALASYLLCQHPSDADSCGECPACRQTAKLEHPDLHFSFPFIKKSDSTTADTYLSEWKKLLRDGCYFSYMDWLDCLGDENKQLVITDTEGDEIINKMGLTSYGGGYKVMIVWHPEKMTSSASNNLLKMLEEPPLKTVFILLSDNPSLILPTILSRTQQVAMSGVKEEDIARALEKRGLSPTDARQIARISGGSYLKALQRVSIGNPEESNLEQFKNLMRMAYKKDVAGLLGWAEDLAGWKRERQKAFLEYCQNLVRENFIYNFHRPEMNYMTDEEAAFASRFASFINYGNIVQFMQELSATQKDVEHNVNGKILFFDFALKVTVLLRRK